MELVDPSMNGGFPEGDVLRCFHTGLLCVQGDPVARPAMSSVVMMLGTDTISLQAPSRPGFIARDKQPKHGGVDAGLGTGMHNSMYFCMVQSDEVVPKKHLLVRIVKCIQFVQHFDYQHISQQRVIKERQ
jgi:hypothetical protein